MKILLLNQPLNNRGDESAHKGLIRKIISTFPNVQIRQFDVAVSQKSLEEFNIHTNQIIYENVPHFIGYLTIFRFALILNIPWLAFVCTPIRILAKRIKESDLILCAPGGICMGGFHNWWHVMSLKLVKYYHKPIAYYGRSIGPFEEKGKYDRIFNNWSFELLRYFGYLSLRDNISIKIAENAGVHPILTTDSAFLDSPRVPIPETLQNIIGEHEYMVFVPNELTWHYRYKTTSSKLITQFYHSILNEILSRDPNILVIMLPQTFNSQINDYNYFKKLVSLYNGNVSRIYVAGPDYNSDLQQTIISEAKYVIGSRYHSLVFAINNNTPFVSLSYEHKMAGLLSTLNKTEMMVDITNVFNNEQSMKNALKEMSDKISQTISMPNVLETQQKAKKFAELGFNAFKKYVYSLKFS